MQSKSKRKEEREVVPLNSNTEEETQTWLRNTAQWWGWASQGLEGKDTDKIVTYEMLYPTHFSGG